MVTLAKDVELRSPFIDKRLILPEGVQCEIVSAELDKAIGLMIYHISILFREMMKKFKEFTPAEKYVIDDVVDSVEFHDCDFTHPPRQLMHIEDTDDAIKITLVK